MDNSTAHNPLLSIVMPVYNAEAYIEKAIDNVLAQTFQQYELLILDALSTDNTKTIIRLRQLNHSRIRLISERDQGIYDAMNKGIAAAKGEWVYFMGCDDAFMDTEVLERFSFMLKADVDILYGNVLWVPDEQLEEGICNPVVLIHRNINHQRIFYRKSLFQQHGDYNLQYKVAADHELNIRFFCNNDIRKKYVPVTVARYYAGGFSSNKTDEVFWDNWKSIFRKNFSQHLPVKAMYEKLGWYCRYLIDQQRYAKALPLFFDVLVNTMSPGFVKLTLLQYFKSRKLHAG